MLYQFKTTATMKPYNNEKWWIDSGIIRDITHEQTAKQFCEALRTIAGKPENLENLESYLSYHFAEWMSKYANTPENITAELKSFADMDI